MAFVVRHSSGFVQAGMTIENMDRLSIPPMYRSWTLGPGGFGVSVDAVDTTTGISARDRARTVQALADPASVPTDFTRPGHVVPLMGVPDKNGDACDAVLALCQDAGLEPVIAMSTLVADSGEVMTLPAAVDFAERYSLPRLLCDTASLPRVNGIRNLNSFALPPTPRPIVSSSH
jgi:3,4-dihydroxy-2-butanone 4-phosphate synthase